MLEKAAAPPYLPGALLDIRLAGEPPLVLRRVRQSRHSLRTALHCQAQRHGPGQQRALPVAPLTRPETPQHCELQLWAPCECTVYWPTRVHPALQQAITPKLPASQQADNRTTGIVYVEPHCHP